MSDKPSMKIPAIDPQTVAAAVGSNYPDAFKPRVAEAGKEENPEAEKIDISSSKDASGKAIW